MMMVFILNVEKYSFMVVNYFLVKATGLKLGWVY